MQPSRDDAINLYLQARNYIDVEIIRMTPRIRDRQAKVATALEFNRRLGDPQKRYPAVQVAGTSGKGSTCHYLSQMLHYSGISTGLHVSPYLQVATEKTWIDGRYASALEFYEAVEEVRPVTEQYRWDDSCPTSVHGMASLALSYVAFARRNIEWCVMETGLGGRFDLVQGLRRELAVITDIGLDHVDSLGETVEEIAWHKAGIMAGAPETLAVRADPRVWRVLEEQARLLGTHLVPLEPARWLCQGDAGQVVVKLPFLGDLPFTPPQSAKGFSLRNMAVAAACADRLAERGLAVHPAAVVRALEGPAFPGRHEVLQNSPEVIIDGAHNRQKMAALARSLAPGSGPFVLVFGATGSKKGVDFLAPLPRRPDHLVLTQPLLFGKQVLPPHHLAEDAARYASQVHVCENPVRAMKKALDLAGPDARILVTGSLYLVGQARNLWYPWQDVLLQQTSYPTKA